MEYKRIIAPSLLSANFTDIRSAIKLAEKAGAAWLHLDIMDGCFVPPISFGAKMAKAVREETDLILDTHLMVINPASQVDFFTDAGVNRVTFHIEAETHAYALLGRIKKAGMAPGISLVPSTPVTALMDILEVVDQILVMTVNPGYGGQSLIQSMLKKVEYLAETREKLGYKYRLVIDGGFSRDTANMVWSAGTDVAVMGTGFFKAEDPCKEYSMCLNC